MKTHPLHLFVLLLLLLPKAANAQFEIITNIIDGIFGFICILPVFDLFCNDCDPNPCLNNGVCTDEVGDFTCECADGFSGDTCEVDCEPGFLQESTFSIRRYSFFVAPDTSSIGDGNQRFKRNCLLL